MCVRSMIHVHNNVYMYIYSTYCAMNVDNVIQQSDTIFRTKDAILVYIRSIKFLYVAVQNKRIKECSEVGQEWLQTHGVSNFRVEL